MSEKELKENYVPKEKLRQESFLERAQWWYRDKELVVRVAFWLVLMAIGAATGKTVGELTELIGTIGEDLNVIIGMIVTTVGSIAGGLVTARDPKNKETNQ